MSICLFTGHAAELCKNGWTDRDDVWGRVIWAQWANGMKIPHRKRHFQDVPAHSMNGPPHGIMHSSTADAAHCSPAYECIRRQYVGNRRCGLLPNFFEQLDTCYCSTSTLMPMQSDTFYWLRDFTDYCACEMKVETLLWVVSLSSLVSLQANSALSCYLFISQPHFLSNIDTVFRLSTHSCPSFSGPAFSVDPTIGLWLNPIIRQSYIAMKPRCV